MARSGARQLLGQQVVRMNSFHIQPPLAFELRSETCHFGGGAARDGLVHPLASRESR
jgi:hypothetical protein